VTIAKYILIQAESGNDVSQLAEQVTGIPGVTKAERVSGPYDVIAEVRETDEDPRSQVAASVIRGLNGVLRAISLPLVFPAVASGMREGPKEAA
jgi:DNA-binding Lrp family transcriptional regulator